jgi:regulatory protein
MEAALRMLARRALSEGEIRERLARREVPAPEIGTVLRRLRDARLVDDRALCADLVRVYREARRYGRLKILRTLRARRFPPGLVEEAMREASSPDGEIEAALAALRKKFREGVPPGREGAAKAFRFLAGRGFLLETCRQAILAFRSDISEEGD